MEGTFPITRTEISIHVQVNIERLKKILSPTTHLNSVSFFNFGSLNS